MDAAIYRETDEKYIRLFSGKLRRYFSFKNFSDCLLLGVGFLQSLAIMARYRPDVVFSKGGYVSVPFIFAARLFRIPIVIHESDSVPGLANRIVSRSATKVLTAFPLDEGEFVGTPIRSEILDASAERGKAFLGFDDDKPILFGFAGSQGSKHMNEIFYNALERLIEHANVVWVTGKSVHWSIDRPQVRIFPFLHEEFADVLAAADLVVCRSGGSIFEVAALKKPMLLIPHPYTGGDHQRKNAEIFVEAGAAEMILDSDLTADLLANKVINLLTHPQRKQELARHAARLSRRDAADRIAKAIFAERKS